MKLIFFIFLIQISCQVYAQNKTTFTYDAKGNMLTATYSGSNKCNNAPQTVIAAKTVQDNNGMVLRVTPVPANTVITIAYTIPAGNTDIEIYNMLGERITIVKTGMQQGGSYTMPFNIGTFASGTYLCVLKTDKGQVVEKFLKE